MIENLIRDFLGKAHADGVSALVVYVFDVDGKSVVRMASNRDDASTRGFLDWCSRIDERAVEAAARALHEDSYCYICTAESDHGHAIKADKHPWDDLRNNEKVWHYAAVQLVAKVLRDHAGRTPLAAPVIVPS